MTLEVTEAGCIDKAVNQWDMDASTADEWENAATWKFTVNPTGDIQNFEATYEEKE